MDEIDQLVRDGYGAEDIAQNLGGTVELMSGIVPTIVVKGCSFQHPGVELKPGKLRTRKDMA